MRKTEGFYQLVERKLNQLRLDTAERTDGNGNLLQFFSGLLRDNSPNLPEQ